MVEREYSYWLIQENSSDGWDLIEVSVEVDSDDKAYRSPYRLGSFNSVDEAANYIHLPKKHYDELKRLALETNGDAIYIDYDETVRGEWYLDISTYEKPINEDLQREVRKILEESSEVVSIIKKMTSPTELEDVIRRAKERIRELRFGTL